MPTLRPGEVNFIDEALDQSSKRVRDSFPCPHCGADLNKDHLDRVLEWRVDPATGETWKRVKFRASVISYVAGGVRREKKPDQDDLAVLSKIDAMALPQGMPTVRFPIEQMYHGSRIEPKGFSSVHHFFQPRAGHALAALWRKAKSQPNPRIREMLLFFVEQAIWGFSVLNRYSPSHFSQVNRAIHSLQIVKNLKMLQ